MLRKIKLGLILAALVGLCACGTDYDWWSGELEGTSKISQIYSSGSAAQIVSPQQKGKLIFKAPFSLKLGTDTQLPDCSLSFSAGDVDIKHKVSGFDRAFKGDTNNGKGCQAFLTSATPTEIETYHSEVTRDDKGEVTLKINFRPIGATGTSGQYEFEFRGTKKGWF